MAFSVLSQASALNPGADLWIVTDIDRSRWTAKLDWYLNFQLCKASRHKSAHLQPFVSAVLQETELGIPDVRLKPNAPLMISSENLLPNKWVVVIPWNEDMDQWAKAISNIWVNLKEPSLRVFLPPGQSAGRLQQEWQNKPSTQEITVVLD